MQRSLGRLPLRRLPRHSGRPIASALPSPPRFPRAPMQSFSTALPPAPPAPDGFQRPLRANFGKNTTVLFRDLSNFDAVLENLTELTQRNPKFASQEFSKLTSLLSKWAKNGYSATRRRNFLALQKLTELYLRLGPFVRAEDLVDVLHATSRQKRPDLSFTWTLLDAAEVITDPIDPTVRQELVVYALKIFALSNNVKSMVKLFANCNALPDGAMEPISLPTYNVIMRKFCRIQNMHSMAVVYDQLLGRGLRPNHMTMYALLRCHSSAAQPDMQRALALVDRMHSEFGLEADQVTYLELMKAATRSRDHEMAQGLFAQYMALEPSTPLEEVDPVPLSLLLDSCVKNIEDVPLIGRLRDQREINGTYCDQRVQLASELLRVLPLSLNRVLDMTAKDRKKALAHANSHGPRRYATFDNSRGRVILDSVAALSDRLWRVTGYDLDLGMSIVNTFNVLQRGVLSERFLLQLMRRLMADKRMSDIVTVNSLATSTGLSFSPELASIANQAAKHVSWVRRGQVPPSHLTESVNGNKTNQNKKQVTSPSSLAPPSSSVASASPAVASSSPAADDDAAPAAFSDGSVSAPCPSIVSPDVRDLATFQNFFSHKITEGNLPALVDGYNTMLSRGVRPDNDTLLMLLKASVLDHGFPAMAVSAVNAIHAIGGSVPHVLYGDVVQSFCLHGHMEEAVALVERANANGVFLGEHAYATLCRHLVAERQSPRAAKLLLDATENAGLGEGGVKLIIMSAIHGIDHFIQAKYPLGRRNPYGVGAVAPEGKEGETVPARVVKGRKKASPRNKSDLADLYPGAEAFFPIASPVAPAAAIATTEALVPWPDVPPPRPPRPVGKYSLTPVLAKFGKEALRDVEGAVMDVVTSFVSANPAWVQVSSQAAIQALHKNRSILQGVSVMANMVENDLDPGWYAKRCYDGYPEPNSKPLFFQNIMQDVGLSKDEVHVEEPIKFLDALYAMWRERIPANIPNLLMCDYIRSGRWELFDKVVHWSDMHQMPMFSSVMKLAVDDMLENSSLTDAIQFLETRRDIMRRSDWVQMWGDKNKGAILKSFLESAQARQEAGRMTKDDWTVLFERFFMEHPWPLTPAAARQFVGDVVSAGHYELATRIMEHYHELDPKYRFTSDQQKGVINALLRDGRDHEAVILFQQFQSDGGRINLGEPLIAARKYESLFRAGFDAGSPPALMNHFMDQHRYFSHKLPTLSPEQFARITTDELVDMVKEASKSQLFSPGRIKDLQTMLMQGKAAHDWPATKDLYNRWSSSHHNVQAYIEQCFFHNDIQAMLDLYRELPKLLQTNTKIMFDMIKWMQVYMKKLPRQERLEQDELLELSVEMGKRAAVSFRTRGKKKARDTFYARLLQTLKLGHRPYESLKVVRQALDEGIPVPLDVYLSIISQLQHTHSDDVTAFGEAVSLLCRSVALLEDRRAVTEVEHRIALRVPFLLSQYAAHLIRARDTRLREEPLDIVSDTDNVTGALFSKIAMDIVKQLSRTQMEGLDLVTLHKFAEMARDDPRYIADLFPILCRRFQHIPVWDKQSVHLATGVLNQVAIGGWASTASQTSMSPITKRKRQRALAELWHHLGLVPPAPTSEIVRLYVSYMYFMDDPLLTSGWAHVRSTSQKNNIVLPPYVLWKMCRDFLNKRETDHALEVLSFMIRQSQPPTNKQCRVVIEQLKRMGRLEDAQHVEAKRRVLYPHLPFLRVEADLVPEANDSAAKAVAEAAAVAAAANSPPTTMTMTMTATTTTTTTTAVQEKNDKEGEKEAAMCVDMEEKVEYDILDAQPQGTNAVRCEQEHNQQSKRKDVRLMDLSLTELKNILRQRRLAITGNKTALRQRLENDNSIFTDDLQVADFSRLKLFELKPMLRQRNLPVSGSKALLIQRLVDYEKQEDTGHVELDSLMKEAPYFSEPDSSSDEGSDRDDIVFMNHTSNSDSSDSGSGSDHEDEDEKV